ncbi:hypothetical protein EV356DRAFT_496428 [Viridothelium virens]|uniref:Uncharacterized protein n=1 Tax=Viridothelium virens TaxID=1048519 RepID=A0A6A6GTT3_VIRVR|nr:hypothetical protein EV356DRAFT_496428 [Viridothelium virens]
MGSPRRFSARVKRRLRPFGSAYGVTATSCHCASYLSTREVRVSWGVDVEGSPAFSAHLTPRRG